MKLNDSSRPPTIQRSLSNGDLALLWDAMTQADLYGVMEAERQKQARAAARFHAVEDALASRITGYPVDTSRAGEDESMNVSLNSPTTTINEAPQPPPAALPGPPTPAWAKVAMTALLAAAVLGCVWMFSQAAKPGTPPAPVTPSTQPGENLNVTVTHGGGVPPAP